MSLATNDYEPSSDVKAAHMIPHFVLSAQSPEGNGGDGDFYIRANDSKGSSDYFQSIVVFPIAILAIGIVSVIVFQIVLICRCLCRRLTCCKVDHTRRSLNINKWSLCGILFAAFFTIHFLYIGNSNINLGVEESMSGFDKLGRLFKGISNVGLELKKESNDLNTIVANGGAARAACCSNNQCSGTGNSGAPLDPSLKTLFNSLGTFGSVMNTAGKGLYDLTDSIPSKIDDANSAQETYLITNKNLIVYIMYAVITVILVCFLLAGLSKIKIMIQIVIVVNEIIIIALTIICPIVMIIVTLLGDFCMEPSDNIINIFDSGSVKDLLTYYLKCTGASPIGGYLTDAVNSNANISSYITDFLNTPQGGQTTSQLCNNTLNTVIQESSKLVTPLNNLVTLIECPNLNAVWNDVINNGLCKGIFSGLFAVWLCLFVVSVLLFVAICLGAVLFVQYEAVENAEKSQLETQAYEMAETSPDGALIAEDGLEMVTVPEGGNQTEKFNTYGVIV